MAVARGMQAAVLCAGLIVSCDSKPAAPPVVAPTAPALPDSTDPALVQMVSEAFQAAEAQPASADLRATLGLVYEANQLWSLGAEAFAAAAKIDSTQPEFPLHQALCLQRMDKAAEGEAILRKTLEQFPDYAPVHYHVGALLLDQGDTDGAIAEFAACEELAPWFRDIRIIIAETWVAQEKPAMALSLIDEFLPGRSYDLRAHYVRGLALEGIGRRSEAGHYLTMGEGVERSFLPDKLSDRLPSYVIETELVLSAADALHSRGKDPQALKMLEAAHKRKSDDAGLLNALGVAYRRSGDSVKGAELINRATLLGPDVVEHWINAALVRYDLRRHADALTAAETAVALDAENAHARYLLGRSLRSLNRAGEAIVALKESHRLDEDSNQTRLSLAEAYVSLGQFVEAKPVLEALIERTPDEYFARHYLTMTQLRLGLADLARENMDKLKKSHPGDERLEELEAMFR